MSTMILNKNGDRFWLNDAGELHRYDGPAIIYVNGSASWYIHGERHRDDGPAKIRGAGCNEWWLAGNEITNQVIEWIEENNLPQYSEWTDKEKVWFKLRFCGI